ncbi:hypothetical protein PXK00_06385 [Phaeobacter sp. QD34_3]|uniref:hypothetical protein n=1 Tax=unclassified Phaeobacter TaxID=2621772 RepID=UPI00237FB86F|nr:MULTISPECIES: hypothetical protein [unclassified Phaeobacter]MDE4132728.1 hypothetical protein [Phaeobacter sp. QD34_3]MDE4136479.1 hypothetical protein [Phaeobacter sp. QD34_24]
MTALSALGGHSNAHSIHMHHHQHRHGSDEHAVQSGPPDHAKAWGWRAKQAAKMEATQPPPKTPAETPAASGIDALLSGSFGEIKLKLEFEIEAGEFKIEVSRDEGGLSVEIEAETDQGEIKIAFESGEHGGLKVEFESDELGEFKLSVENLSEGDPATALEIVDAENAPATAPAAPSGADMEAMVLDLASGDGAPSSTGAMSEYEQMKTLFS